MANLTTQNKLKIINDSPILWLKNFIKILSPEGILVPFEVNEEQKYFMDYKSKYNIILKSRKLGFTTLSLGLMLHSACTIPNSNYLMLSYDGESVQNIFNILKNMYENIPEKYRAEQRRMNKQELFLKNGSRISVKVAGNKELGRSFTCQIIHCSEFAFWSEEQQEKGLLGLEEALAKNDTSIIIIESTANGIGNNYYRIFNNAFKGNSKYKAFFFNWFSNKKQFHAEYKIAELWYKSTNHQARLKESDIYDTYELDLLKRGANLLQLMWRQFRLQDITIDEFNQEFPSIPEEAFVSTNKGVFDAATITHRYNYIPKPLNINEIVKPLPELLMPYVNKGLYLYQNVKRSERYFGGIDTGAGLKNDNSGIVILDSSGEQVGVFYRNDIPVYKFAKICFEIGHYFNYCMYLPERNTYGLDLIQRLRKEMSYLQVLKTKHFDKVTGKKLYEYGWYTDTVSKSKLIMDFKEVFEEGIILVNDKETLDEMKIFQEDNGKMGNVRGVGNYDDLIIAFALAVQALKVNKSYI